MNWITSHSQVDEDVIVGSRRINCLLFVDDLVLLLLASSQRGVQHALDRFAATCDKTGLKFSTKNTKVLCISGKPSQCTVQVSDNTLKQVVKFMYLGVVFTGDRRRNKEYDTRIGKVNAALRKLVISLVTKREFSNKHRKSVGF